MLSTFLMPTLKSTKGLVNQKNAEIGHHREKELVITIASCHSSSAECAGREGFPEVDVQKFKDAVRYARRLNKRFAVCLTLPYPV